MIDIVFPKDDEESFIKMAERLGLNGLCFVYDKPKDISYLKSKTKINLSTASSARMKGCPFFMKAPDDQMQIRHILEQTRPDVLYGLEFNHHRDFMHHRASGLNHVMASIAEEKGVTIGFSFAGILSAKTDNRAVCIGRMMQNIRFARKYGFKVVLASFADSPWKMRAPQEIISFFRCINMSGSEVKLGLGWVIS